jgi:anaerobic magnesium-protoporphyrin IX monomethyl ester cyclase
MLDLLLLQPPIRDFYLTRKRTQPYGLACLAASLRAAGLSVAILDGLARGKSRIRPLPAEMQELRDYYPQPDRSPLALFHPYRHFGYSLEHLARRACDLAPRVIGISANFSAYADLALALVRAVKHEYPHAPIVVGGHHATALPESVLAEPAVDFVILGEGEAALVALVKALQRGDDPRQIPGVGQRTPDGKIHLPERVAVADLDHGPPPAVDLIAQGYYQRRHKRTLVVTASRGCPFACSYCCMTREGPFPYRRRSVEGVLAEIDAGIAVDATAVGFIDFEDENLALDKAWLHALLTGIEQRFGADPPELRAMNGLYPPSLDEVLVAHMARAGFKSLNLALASTLPDQLTRFNRPDVRIAFDHCLTWAAAHGMDAVGYLIAGAPLQDPQASVDDLIYLAKRRVLAGISIFYPAPGSRDYKRCERLGCLPETLSLLRSSALPLNTTTSRLQSVTLLRLGRLVNFIKTVIDRGDPLPPAAPCGPMVDPDLERYQMGRLLLGAFLADRRLLGVDDEGRVYEQPASEALCAHFHMRMAGQRIAGVTSMQTRSYPQ